jgi:hypothetical protein
MAAAANKRINGGISISVSVEMAKNSAKRRNQWRIEISTAAAKSINFFFFFFFFYRNISVASDQIMGKAKLNGSENKQQHERRCWHQRAASKLAPAAVAWRWQ